MNIDCYEKNNITIITVEDKINTITAPTLEKYINNLLDEGINKIIIDLTHLEYISSAGLRTFLSTAKKIEKLNGKLSICSLNEVVQEIFDISGFSTIFDVSLDKEIALSTF